MPSGAGDRDRLTQIEAGLVAADPVLAARFRRWSSPPTWTAAPAWTLVVFLVGFTTWVIAPAAGVVAVVLGVIWLRWRVTPAVRARRRRSRERRRRPRS